MGSRRRAAKAAAAELSDRQRYWLRHIEAAQRRGEALKHYATRKGLSESSLYEAKRRLRAAGVLDSAARRPGTKPAKAKRRFTRVAVVEAPGTGASAALRVRLPGGAELTWSEAPRGEALRELVGWLSR